MTFAYTVTAEVDDEATARAWAEWLRTKHLADVVAAGASQAELIQWSALVFESRYRFESRAAFERYEAEHAPRLRAEGLAAFPKGVRLSRKTGDVVAAVTR